MCKDGVYRVKCVYCSEFYTGEPLQKRMYHHWYDYTRGSREDLSALSEHCKNEHPGLPMKLELVDFHRTDGFVDRKVRESVVQQDKPSSINRRIEGAGTAGNLYLV